MLFRSAEAVFYSCGVLALIWLLVLVGMKELPRLDNRVLSLAPGNDWAALAERLRSVPGVVETVVVEEQALALLKVDSSLLDEQQLLGVAGTGQS